MKFGTLWKQKRLELPPILSNATLDYKKYKKLTKTHPHNLMTLLQTDLQFVDATFKTQNKPSCFRHRCSTSELYNFALINSLTLYKTCKRLDKRLNTREYLKWYSSVCSQHIYGFLNRRIHLKLLLSMGNHKVEECPICLESKDQGFLVLNCGHITCIECALSLLQVAHVNGTLENKIAFARHQHPCSCPICRDTAAFTQYDVY